MEEGNRQQYLLQQQAVQMQQQIMQQQIEQQQMTQKQTMQQSMMELLNKKMQKKIIEDKPNFCGPGFSVIFRYSYESYEDKQSIMIQCMPDEKVSVIIEKYRTKSMDHDLSKKFIYNAKALHPSLTVADAGLSNNANIFVVANRGIRGG